MWVLAGDDEQRHSRLKEKREKLELCLSIYYAVRIMSIQPRYATDIENFSANSE
jgi:hypothetical protein